ncbi:hypothetical protein REPUB_Repub04eG0143300 [Reevesia pubescens]
MEDLEITLDSVSECDYVLSRFALVGHIIADKVLNRRGVFSILRGIWSEDMVPCIREVEVGSRVYDGGTKSVQGAFLDTDP